MNISTPTPEQMNKGIEAWAPVERAWRDDPAFRDRLAADAAAAVAEQGLELPRGVSELRVVENTPEVFHLAFPADPNASVPDASLDQVAGGSGGSYWSDAQLSHLGPRYTSYTPGQGGM